jgi:hypothetical protein
VAPLDPGRDWLAAGITGLARQREWDAVATVVAPGDAGDEVQLVALADGRVLVESGPEGLDGTFVTTALEGALDPPYRALAVRRPELWTIGAVAIEAVRLDPDPPGEELALAWDGETTTLHVDGAPAGASAAEALEELASSRVGGPYAAHAHRLAGDLFEISILPL